MIAAIAFQVNRTVKLTATVCRVEFYRVNILRYQRQKFFRKEHSEFAGFPVQLQEARTILTMSHEATLRNNDIVDRFAHSKNFIFVFRKQDRRLPLILLVLYFLYLLLRVKGSHHARARAY